MEQTAVELVPGRPGTIALTVPLDRDTIAETAAHNILFDRDETGAEYWQVYTRAFEKRFFFETVERRGPYAGYGAANAPIRLGAQSQFRTDPEIM